MFSFFRRRKKQEEQEVDQPQQDRAEQPAQVPAEVKDSTLETVEQAPIESPAEQPAAIEPVAELAPEEPEPDPEAAQGRRSRLSRLRAGLARTGKNNSSICVGVRVDEDLFEELETALIMADAGMEATESLLTELRAQVRKDSVSKDSVASMPASAIIKAVSSSPST